MDHDKGNSQTRRRTKTRDPYDSMETKRCIERAHTDHDTIDYLMRSSSWQGSVEGKALRIWRTMSWQAFGVYSS